jgi:hypothetical protein
LTDRQKEIEAETGDRKKIQRKTEKWRGRETEKEMSNKQKQQTSRRGRGATLYVQPWKHHTPKIGPILAGNDTIDHQIIANNDGHDRNRGEVDHKREDKVRDAGKRIAA